MDVLSVGLQPVLSTGSGENLWLSAVRERLWPYSAQRCAHAAASTSARARTVEDLEHAQIDPEVRAGRRRRLLAESPLAFPAHGRSIRQYRQAAYEFEKGALAPRGNGLAPARPRHLPAVEPGWRPGGGTGGRTGVHQSERLTAVSSRYYSYPDP